MLVKNLQAKSDHFVTKLTLSLDVRTTTWFFCRICIAISLSAIVNPLSGGDLDETYAEIEDPPFKSWCSPTHSPRTTSRIKARSSTSGSHSLSRGLNMSHIFSAGHRRFDVVKWRWNALWPGINDGTDQVC
jgi:hypothetical protein